jgi:hypothetical protein
MPAGTNQQLRPALPGIFLNPICRQNQSQYNQGGKMMHLAPGQRAILSYYSSSAQAEQAARELKEAGFRSAEIEKMPKLSFPGDDSLRSYATGVAQLMQSVTDMEVQPTGWPVTEPLESHAYIITLVVDQQNANQALSIVRKYASIVN